MPKFGTERWSIRREGQGGFLQPPTHPEHYFSARMERWTRSGWEEWSSYALTSAAREEYLPEWVRERARQILADWQAPSIDDRDVQLWIKQCWSHWRNCYDIGERDLLVMQSRPCGDLPTVEGQGLWMILNIANHYAVKTIRSFYPEYVPSVRDMSADCAECHHHVNAHANGDGGVCTVIVDPNGYELAKHDRNYDVVDMLCNCPEYVLQ